MQLDTRKRTIGVNFDSRGNALIKVWAPVAENMEIDLPGRGERLQLNRGNYGYWTLETDKVKPGDVYRFIINGSKKLPDPASLYQPEGVHGYSQAIGVDTMKWTDSRWKNIPLDEYLIYELHVGTYTAEGDFSGVIKKLGYLLSLGVTAIEIMPVAQFPDSRNWGYDGVYPFAVHNTYGGPEALQQLVNACHDKGLCVILDVVYNHLGPEGNYLAEYGPYFTGKYHTPWGDAINFDDAWCDNVRQYFIENVLMWFRDFHIDALRLDAVHAIKDFSGRHILTEMKEHVNALMEITDRTHYLIIECDLNDSKYINAIPDGGYGMDAQWIDEFHHALRVAAGNERNGYYADFKGIPHLAKAYTDAYVYNGVYSEHRKKTFGTPADNPGKQFIVFSQNHDQVGNRMLGERTSALVSFEMQKLLAGAVMVSPYLPLLFMGEEYSEPNPFLYFVSHTDPELVAAVKKGRKAEFASFHIHGEPPDPQAIETFMRSKLQWELHERGRHKVMLDYYKALIKLRKNNSVLKCLDRTTLKTEYTSQSLTLSRWQGEEEIMCLMNFSKEEIPVEMPAHKKKWEKIFDSAAPVWQGKSTAAQTAFGGDTILSQPESLLIYASDV